jgi:hypothetical protein
MGMSPKLLRPRATGFTPKSISGLAAWYDASVTSSITIQTGVQQWSDLSGNGRNLIQNTTNNQPAYTNNQINGKPAVVFDKTNDRLTWAGTLSQPTTAYCIGKWNAAPTAGNETMFDSNVNGNRMRLFATSSLVGGVTTYFPAIHAGTELRLQSEVTLTSYAVYEAIFNGTSSFVGQNNSVTNSGNAGSTASDGIAFNAFGGFAAFGGVSIAEFMLYGRLLSSSERASVRRYLARKYNLTVA